jgi:hypothetical protein
MLALSLLLACQPPPRVPVGRMDVSWNGSARGSLSGGATAEWCGILKLLEIRGIRGDTGIALAIYPADTIQTGDYPVREPTRAESLPPAAGLALRWTTETAVKGFQGESGSIRLGRSAAGVLSARVKAAARSVTDSQRIWVQATFRDLTVHPQTRGCVKPAETVPRDAQPSDTQLH